MLGIGPGDAAAAFGAQEFGRFAEVCGKMSSTSNDL
eukprot:CAMPEP_0115646672 /NCGR_PEP_ID=MMETSP0272-20121206/39052_1 /TAXON_ID=71861 /ORGANISM="Scrippsiella trochoidea, Strain CCMP3099" /LENGTH=35 /DNA_ID= /DNA_START= /DNA_END= /DNA_ORIENTATION=